MTKLSHILVALRASLHVQVIATMYGISRASVYELAARYDMPVRNGVAQWAEEDAPPDPSDAPEPSGDVTEAAWEVLGREGGAVCVLNGADVYVTIGGSLPKIYCSARSWPTSHAARRMADPQRRRSAWDAVGLFGDGPIGGERV